MQDDSTLVALSGEAGVYVRPRVEAPDTNLSGTVASVHPANESAFLSRWGYVTVNVGSDDFFHVLLSPAGVPFPLRAGERISVSILSAGTQVVLGPQGEVLLARIEGNASLPGWRAEKGAVAPGPAGAEQFKTWFHVVVSHRGRVAVAAPGQWRRLVTDDGTWLITGSALDTVLPSAQAPHFWFAMIRERQG